MNKDVWESFTPIQQEMVSTACMAENNYMLAEFNYNNGAALETLVSKHNVQVRDFPDEVFDAMCRQGEEVVAEVGEIDDLSKRIYQSYLKSRKETSAWSNLGERNFLKARNRILG